MFLWYSMKCFFFLNSNLTLICILQPDDKYEFADFSVCVFPHIQVGKIKNYWGWRGWRAKRRWRGKWLLKLHEQTWKQVHSRHPFLSRSHDPHPTFTSRPPFTPQNESLPDEESAPPCRRRRRGSIANIQMRRRRLAGTLPLALPWLRPLIGLYLHPVLRHLRGDEAALVGDNDGDYSPRCTASLSAPRRRFSQATNLIHHA